MVMNFAFLCKPDKIRKSGHRVAIIGAGPAGLAAAGFLVCKGHDVTIYEKLPLPGGLMVFAIPSRRIRPQHVIDGCKTLEEEYGVKFVLKTKVVVEDGHDEGDDFVENKVNLKDLVKEYNAILVATGIWRSKIPSLPGSNLSGVYSALDFLFKWKTYELGLAEKDYAIEVSGKKVAVIGAGHSAVDAALTALDNGAVEVYLLYRRTINEAPAGRFEIIEAIREGIIWTELVSPLKINGNNRVESITLVKNRLEDTGTGRPRPVPIEGSEYDLDVDFVIFATGESSTPPPGIEKIGVKVDKKYGSILVSPNFETSSKGVFAAGDVVTGPSFVGRAIEAGLKAAMHVDRYLKSL